MEDISKNVDIGFLEKKAACSLHPKHFPSKVGGKPAWLDLRNIPPYNKLLCKKCNDPMIFLCQVYAPYEESDDSFHRTIFIFICRNSLCCTHNSTDNLAIYRCQLPRKNDFFSYEPAKEDANEHFPMHKWAKLCNVCGLQAPSHCSKCKKTFYCSRKHQILDWQKDHKESCVNIEDANCYGNSFIVTESGKTILFDEWELIVDEEDDEEATSAVDVSTEMEKMRKMLDERKVGSLNNISDNELEQYATTPIKDKVFNKFSKRVARHPEQVLRYDRGGTPLWITDGGSNSIEIPHCQYCNGERQFEFQIMPQLLNFINVGVEVNSIDWGILAVYTCKNSCEGNPLYKEEYIIKQDLTT